MKRKILTVLAILLGLAGLGVLLYPSVSNWMEQAKQRRQIAAYQEAQAQDGAGKAGCPAGRSRPV